MIRSSTFWLKAYENGTFKAGFDWMPGFSLQHEGGRSQEVISAIRKPQDECAGNRIMIDKSFSLKMIQMIRSAYPMDDCRTRFAGTVAGLEANEAAKKKD